MRVFTFFIISCFMALTAISAYAGGKAVVDIAPAPAYSQSGPIPITVGIDVDETPSVQSRVTKKTDRPYGPAIAGELKKMNVFSNIIYPYKKGGAADAVLFLAIRGQWNYFSTELEPNDYWSGRPGSRSVEGAHEVKVALTAKNRQVINSSVSVESKGQYSGQDYDAITGKLNDIQTRKIAVAVADLLQKQKALIVAKVLNKPLEEVLPTATTATTSAAPEAGGEYKTADKLKELEELRAGGVLSDTEFGKAKNRLLQMQKLDDLYKSGVLTREEVEKAKARLLKK